MSRSAQSELIVHGQLLALTKEYLVFTTGDAVRRDDATVIALTPRLGQSIRVHLDPTTHHARLVETMNTKPANDEIDATSLPRAYVTAAPGSARTETADSGAHTAHIVTVSFTVQTPDDTPLSDEIYLSTERSNFSPGELKMNRLDVHRWGITLPLVEGTTLHYQYTRGNYATIERDASGDVIPPHALEARYTLHIEDTVPRWADTL